MNVAILIKIIGYFHCSITTSCENYKFIFPFILFHFLSPYITIDMKDTFSEYGAIKSIGVNIDNVTGFCKGYALIEYAYKSEAQDAINALHGTELLGKTINVDWAFVGGGSSMDDAIGSSKKVKNRRR